MMNETVIQHLAMSNGEPLHLNIMCDIEFI